MPASNVEHWVEKFRRTTERDRLAFQKLERSGWTTAIIWECKMEAGISDLISMLTDIAQAGAEKPLKAKEQLRSAADRSTCDDSGPLPPLRNLLELADPNTLLHTLAGNWRDHDD